MNSAAQGTSDTTVDSVAVPTMKSSSARRVEPSALASSQQANRRSRPVLAKACAITNITSTKKNTGLMKLLKAAPSGATPSIGCATRASTAVMAIGSASVTHRMSAMANSAAAAQARRRQAGRRRAATSSSRADDDGQRAATPPSLGVAPARRVAPCAERARARPA